MALKNRRIEESFALHVEKGWGQRSLHDAFEAGYLVGQSDQMARIRAFVDEPWPMFEPDEK